MLAGEMRNALRRLLRSRLFTTVSILTLALGIGANAAIFTVVQGVLLKPLPFPDPEPLVGVWHRGFGFSEGLTQSPATYFTYREENRVFEDVGMWDNTFVAVTGIAEPERVEAILVTDGTLPLLRVQPLLGRLFTAADDAPGSPETVLLSHGYWQSRFGGGSDVVGRTLVVNGKPREIVGVLPEEMHFLRFDPALWIPFQWDRSRVHVGNFSFQAIARLKSGVTLEAANADVARMIPLVVEKFPRGLTLEELHDVGFGPNVRPLARDLIGDVENVLWVLFGTVGFVLVIACANVANLFLVRADGRQREIAIRSAMGGTWRDLARAFLLESASLGLVSGVVGLALAAAAVRLLVALRPQSLPRLEDITIDGTVVAFTMALSLAAGIAFGLLPVLRYGGSSLLAALKESGRTSSGGRERQRMRSALVVSQIALALVLLVGSGLMLRTLRSLQEVHPGFVRPEELLTFKISIPSAEIEDVAGTTRAHERILRLIESIPGVRSVGLSSSITMDGWDSNDGIYVEEFPTPEGQVPPIRRFKWISERYFETMGNPVIAGRAIRWSDVLEMTNVAVVTENFAREYWERPSDALGKRIREHPDSPWREIVGVVGNIHDDGVTEKPTATIYWPMLQRKFWGDEVHGRRTMGFAVRTTRGRLESPELLEEIRGAVWSVNPNLPIADIHSQKELLDRTLAPTSFALVMLGIASAVALLLGAVGIYGVVSYAVSQRVREMGVRMALGARRRDVSRLVLRDGALLIVCGLGLGILFALLCTRFLAALLHGVEPVDPATFAAVSVTLAGVALLSSYLPARRAAQIEPTEALRWE